MLRTARSVLPLVLLAIGSAAGLCAEAPDRSALLRDVARELPAVSAASRAVLVGELDPDEQFRIRWHEPGFTDAGYKPPGPGHMNGGPGERIIQIYIHDNAMPDALADYEWHQAKFRAELVRMRDASRKVSERLAPLVAKAQALADASRRGAAIGELRPAGGEAAGGWAGFCVVELDRAAAAGDAAAVERWSGELAAALFALEDVHRWLEFLVGNQLLDLDYMVLGKGLFVSHAARGEGEYSRPMQISRFPGGTLNISVIANYFEVERQGRRLFSDADAWAVAVGKAPADVPAAIWLPPDVRGLFAELRAKLSPANRAAWDRAAAAPFERSFLANHLWRMAQADAGEPMGVVLQRFDRKYPRAEVADLMDVIVYRAGLGMAGAEWADRYDPRLMEGAVDPAMTDRPAALAAARRAQYAVYGGGHNYQGLVLSLRRALDTGKMDCIRATDMIGAYYRNAGLPGFVSVRWCRGGSGHTIAGVEYMEDGKRKVFTVDGLYRPGEAEGTWPDSYFNGRHGGLYSAELNGRGLDNNVLLEAYVIRGENAGTLMRARVPYLPGREKAATAKVYDGPYPPAP